MIRSFLIQFLAPCRFFFFHTGSAGQGVTLRPTVRYSHPRSSLITPPFMLAMDVPLQHSRVFVSDFSFQGKLQVVPPYANSTIDLRDVQCLNVQFEVNVANSGGCTALLPCTIVLHNITANSLQQTEMGVGPIPANTWLRLSHIAYFRIFFHFGGVSPNTKILVERSVLLGIVVQGQWGSNSRESPFVLRIEHNTFLTSFPSSFSIIDMQNADFSYSAVSISHNKLSFETDALSASVGLKVLSASLAQFRFCRLSLVRNMFASLETYFGPQGSQQLHVELWGNVFGFLRLSVLGSSPIDPHILVGNTAEEVSAPSLCTSSGWFCACNSVQYIAQRFCSRTLTVNRCGSGAAPTTAFPSDYFPSLGRAPRRCWRCASSLAQLRSLVASG